MTENAPQGTAESGPGDQPELTGVDRHTLDGAQRAALQPDSNADTEFQAMPPGRAPSGEAPSFDASSDADAVSDADFDEGGEA